MDDLPPVIPLRDTSVTSREQEDYENDQDDDQIMDYSPPQASHIQSSINEQNSSPGGQSHYVSSASVEPNFLKTGTNSAFSRLQNFAAPSPEDYHQNGRNNSNNNNHHTLPLATIPEQQMKLYQRQKPLFGVDPIGRLLSFNTATTTDDEQSELDKKSQRTGSEYEGSKTPAGREIEHSRGGESNQGKSSNNNNNNNNNEPASAAKSAGTNADSIMIGSPMSPQHHQYQYEQQHQQVPPARDPNAPVVVPASVTNRRRMAASLRAPLRNAAKSSTPTPSNIEAFQTSFRDEDDDSDYDDGFRSVSHQSQQQNTKQQHFSPSAILGDLPAYQSPITHGDGGMSLVTVLEEYNVIRNCKAWLTETQARSFQSLGTQGDQLLDWQRRRLEQQSETILDDLASTLNPGTIAEMFDAIAGSLDQVENALEPAFQDKISELTSLRNTVAIGDGGENGEIPSGPGMKALSSYVNLLSLEADRILDLASNIHVSLDSIKADLAEARSSDASFDLDRKQSRRNFIQKVSILEDESRQLKLDLRREMKVSLDRDRRAKKRFDTVHGQLEALLKGAELFDEVREQLADTAKELEESLSRTIRLRLNHNKDMTAAQESQENNNSEDVNNNNNSPGAPSPNSKAGVQFYQRVAAVSRKLRDHGFDLAAMMSPSAQKEKEYTLNADGSVKIPTVYQKTNTACFVDPSIVFATENAKDLGAIEDIADEFFAPMAMEAYDQRRGRSSSVDDDDYYNNTNNLHHLNKPRRGGGGGDGKIQQQQQRSNQQRNFATPSVPVALSTIPATVDHLEQEAREQAAELLREAKIRTEDANNLLNAARRRAAAMTRTQLLPQYQQQPQCLAPLSTERPRLPTAAIPDSRIESVDRIKPQSPDQSQALRSATSLRDLVPAPLRGFLPKEQVQPEEDQHQHQQQQQPAGNEPKQQQLEEEEENKKDHLNQTPPEQSLETGKKNSQPQTATANQNPKRPRRNSNTAATEPKNQELSKPGELPVSISYKVGMPFGSVGTVAGEERTLPADSSRQQSRSSSINDGIQQNPDEPSSRTGSLSLSEARRRRKEEKLKQQQHNNVEISPQRYDHQPQFSPYDDRTPPQLRGFPTPNIRDVNLGNDDDNDNADQQENYSNDIAYVSAPNHTGTPGTTDQFYYPHQKDKTVAAVAKKKSPTSSSKSTNVKAKVDSNNNPAAQRQRQQQLAVRRNSDVSNQSSSNDNHHHHHHQMQPRMENTNSGPSIFDEVRNPHHQFDDEHFYDDLENFDGSLEDYGATYPEYENDDQQYPRLDDNNNNNNEIVHIDLSGAVAGAGAGRKKPPARGVPKPAAFSKGVSNPARKQATTPTKSHVAIPKPTTKTSNQPKPIIADIDLSHYATKSKGVPYEDPQGHFETLGGRNNDNNNNKNTQVPSYFSNPSSSINNNSYNGRPENTNSSHIPTWIDLMNTKTGLQSEFTPEYMDIARYRLEQERNDPSRMANNNNGLDRRNYDLLPSVGLNRAIREAENSASRPKRTSSVSFLEAGGGGPSSISSKLAGLPMVATNPSPSQLANAPAGTRLSPMNTGGGGALRTARVPAFVVPPAPKPRNSQPQSIHTPVDSTGSQEDIRRHLDRMKLDQQEAIAKFRGSPFVQGLL